MTRYVTLRLAYLLVHASFTRRDNDAKTKHVYSRRIALATATTYDSVTCTAARRIIALNIELQSVLQLTIRPLAIAALRSLSTSLATDRVSVTAGHPSDAEPRSQEGDGRSYSRTDGRTNERVRVSR